MKTCHPAQLQESMLGYLQATFAHSWPGTDGMTVQDVLLQAIASRQVRDRQDLASDLEAYFDGGQAGNKLEDQFKLVLDPKTLDAIAAHMDGDEAIANTIMTRKQLRAVALELMMWEVYQGLREGDVAVECDEVKAVKLSGETFQAHTGEMQEQLAEFLKATRRK